MAVITCSKLVAVSLVAMTGLPIVTGQGLPLSMQGLLAESPSQHHLAEINLPQLGELHKRFVRLPASCEVLVNVAASSVNPADLVTPGPFPQVMGSDIAGVVVAIEPSCTRLKVGDRVWADIGAITAVAEKSGRSKENGAYAQFAVALESQLGALPRNIDFREGASLPKVALTALKALKWYGGAPYSSNTTSVLILGGSGGTGTSGIQLAKAFGARTILTTTSKANLDYVKSLGASEAIDYRAEDWAALLEDDSLNAIFDFVGVPGTGDKAMPKLKTGGHYVTICGELPKSPRSDVQSTSFINSQTNLDNVDLLEALRDMVESEKLRMTRVKSFSLMEIEEAFNESRRGHVVGKLGIDLPGAAASCGEGFVPDAVYA